MQIMLLLRAIRANTPNMKTRGVFRNQGFFPGYKYLQIYLANCSICSHFPLFYHDICPQKNPGGSPCFLCPPPPDYAPDENRADFLLRVCVFNTELRIRIGDFPDSDPDWRLPGIGSKFEISWNQIRIGDYLESDP